MDLDVLDLCGRDSETSLPTSQICTARHCSRTLSGIVQGDGIWMHISLARMSLQAGLACYVEFIGRTISFFSQDGCELDHCQKEAENGSV